MAGFFIGAHYSLWNLSLELTSVAHSLLFLCSTPLIMITYSLLIGDKVKVLALIGIATGFTGMIIICFQGKNSEGSTWYGDLIALAGAFTTWFHYSIVESMMNKKPMAFLSVVYFVASAFCLVASIIHHIFISGFAGFHQITETFAYFYNFEGIYVAYLGIFVGFFGNGCFYYMLNHTNVLLVAIVINFEPLTGTIFAWFTGYQSEPSLLTWIGGSILFIGNLIATISGKLKTHEESKKITRESVISEIQA